MSIEEKLCSNDLMKIVYNLHRNNHKVARGKFRDRSKVFDFQLHQNRITQNNLI